VCKNPKGIRGISQIFLPTLKIDFRANSSNEIGHEAFGKEQDFVKDLHESAFILEPHFKRGHEFLDAFFEQLQAF
jgi:hypothetical protein